MDADKPQFAHRRPGWRNRTELIETIESDLSGQPSQVWLDQLSKAGVPAGKVRALDEVYTWEQTLSQGLLIDLDHPTAGRVALPGPALPARS